jgi:gamma-glutamyltranspeptidase
LAETLRRFGAAPDLFYRGRWARDAVALLTAEGGRLSAEDLAGYAPEVEGATRAHFGGYDVYAAGLGGLRLLVGLSALERLRGGLRPAEPVWEDPTELEKLVRVHRAVSAWDGPAAGTAADDEDAVLVAAEALARDMGRRVPESSALVPVAHSASVVVVDDEGNVAVGTHSIEALAWGDGLFVNGVPLATAAPYALPATGKSLRDVLTGAIVLQGGAPRAGLALYGAGEQPADMQILDDILVRGLDAEEAVLAPRVGSYVYDSAANRVDTSRIVADPRMPTSLLCALRQRDLQVVRAMPGVPPGVVDTGFPTLVTILGSASGRLLHGMAPDAGWIQGSAAGD